jgi:aspartyl-tRNA synthetase
LYAYATYVRGLLLADGIPYCKKYEIRTRVFETQIHPPHTNFLSVKFETRQVRGQHYDLVLNGVEIGGGSVRVHDADMQEHIFSNVLQVRRAVFSFYIRPTQQHEGS